ncbi:alpha-glucuronidase family glycosyl hydrolase [Sphingomonas lenta]|uniref:Xylan alpha-1,2-glucuronidase n=1 Tax=Sphingomonas lenta TaxID=1141887 RepID=A0A2A2SBV0_9SPHN|nr:alpha-glucuronidase family glycosyl hydrolase [Sphingomonas lenta]PAX06738.1 alpha-glucuronidase [Sphingomonas lenta]
MRALVGVLCALLLLLGLPDRAAAEDSYELWLRYRPLPAAARAGVPGAVAVDPAERDARVLAARDELFRAFAAMSGGMGGGGEVVLGTPATSARVRALRLDLGDLGDEGYLVRRVMTGGRPVTVVAANGGAGVLYGAFALIRRLQLGRPVEERSAPKVRLRVLNHWDNLDRSVERGYAGQSIWDWWRLPGHKDPRYVDYARANASLGINGTILNNVNAKADSLTAPYLAKAAAVADVLRPYGMKVYLSARFSAPIELGGLETADPLDPSVQAWWRAKADEIYRVIPDFGGFLVKANSEGQPGPRDYGRSHADGANMLAEALRPHGGAVMWRAFVYQETDPEDRAKQAYTEFKPQDGRFAPNVLVQVKNGPIDFQPREPFHPLFGAMPRTPLMLEFQITKEYLGFATHLVYLGELFAETLRSDTYARGPGSTVSRVVDGSLDGHRLTGMAGVANIGSDRDWTGSTFDQANWYAFGRLAWDPDASARTVAAEWAGLTFTTDPAFARPVADLMMASRQAMVDYMTPLGLAHLMGTGHHHGPAPWVSDLARPEWNPAYYHRADARGIGFDRTSKGSNAVGQYAGPAARRFARPETTGEDHLLWFHHLPWDHRMPGGATLWETLVRRYDRGVAAVAGFRARWAGLRPFVDAERWSKTADLLKVQEEEARWWRDASVAYWRSLNGRALPPGSPEPAHPLEYYKALRFPYAPGQAH